jgi:hypothetical protein
LSTHVFFPLKFLVQHGAKNSELVKNIGFWDTWTMELGRMELAARCIFTLAVICDVWSLSMVDNEKFVMEI